MLEESYKKKSVLSYYALYVCIHNHTKIVNEKQVVYIYILYSQLNLHYLFQSLLQDDIIQFGWPELFLPLPL